jgi:hypothetical protein
MKKILFVFGFMAFVFAASAQGGTTPATTKQATPVMKVDQTTPAKTEGSEAKPTTANGEPVKACCQQGAAACSGNEKACCKSGATNGKKNSKKKK